ncbi:MAG TPA: hypothetical protein VMA09_20965 [Candidatus Binataceae bacterium]|nr:hypothetical protein [Candidatus Binataceae bacterium]
MNSSQRHRILGRSIGMLIVAGAVACALTGCAPVYGYPDYPSYGYAPYSWGWGNTLGYDPGFVVHHPWEDHWGAGHHTEFYHPAPGYAGSGFHGAPGGFHGTAGGGSHGAPGGGVHGAPAGGGHGGGGHH